MADNQQKPGNKIGETLLGVLGSLGSIAGPLLTGRDIDFGLPFKLGSAYLQNERMTNDLMKALNSNPHTADIVEGVQAIQSTGKSIPELISQGGQAQPAMTDMEYYQSPDFLKELTRLGRGDIAEQVLQKRMLPERTNPIDDVMKVLALQNYQTPEEKRVAALEDKQFIMDQMNKSIADRQSAAKQEAAQIKREQWSAGEIKSLQDYDLALNNSRLLLDKLNAGVSQDVLSAVVGKSPPLSRLATMMDPSKQDQIQEYRDILKMVMTAVKTQSGVQYGFRELQWIKSSQPNEWDTPSMFKRGITMALNTQQWNKFGLIISKAQRAGNLDVALREGMTPEQIRAWKTLDAQLKERATSPKNELNIFADPKNAKLLSVLGMGMIPEVQKKK